MVNEKAVGAKIGSSSSTSGTARVQVMMGTATPDFRERTGPDKATGGAGLGRGAQVAIWARCFPAEGGTGGPGCAARGRPES